MSRILFKKQLSGEVFQMRIEAPLIARERRAAAAINKLLK